MSSSYDTDPSVFKRPLPEPSNADEPQSKRHKSDEDGLKPICIEDKVNQGAYKLLDHLVLDLKKVIDDRAVELRAAAAAEGESFDDKTVLALYTLRDKATEMHNREMSYPQNAPSTAMKGSENLDDMVQKPADDNVVLTIFGQAPQGRNLFSSLPKRKFADDDGGGAVKSLSDVQLPNGMSLTTVLPTSVSQKAARVPNLGELFPSPANLPPLEAPKASKNTTKSKILGFHHPELADRSTYRNDKDSYFSKELTTGVWLDYSNATPVNQKKDRQRVRNLSLQGQKPSSVDVEISEMEALFRGSFSSFAPEKDDSGAVISSGEVGRVWYQRQGHRYMQQMIEAELSDEVEEIEEVVISPDLEAEIAKEVEEWDESLVDPELAEASEGKKSDDEKEVEDTLQEISDLIETLASYQRNRHLTLPTGQNRGPTDPAKTDMLNGSLAQEPSDEERETYELLRDQLAVIIQTLPPYAVARLNSDKLDELNVSRKIEIRSEVYKGVMEEDEASARLRHQQAQAAQVAQTPRQPQRAPSFHSATPYQPGQQQYNRQFQVPNPTPVPVPNHYQQSPARNQVPPSYQRQVSAPMPAGMPPQQHRPTSGHGPFARPTGWNSQQPMQPLRGYSTPGAVPQYQGTPGQPRVAAGYQQPAQSGTPGQFPPQYRGYQPPQPQAQSGLQQSQYQQQPSNIPHMNGGVPMPPRTMSPQVSHFPAAQNYSPRAGQQQPPQMQRTQPYGTPGQPGGHPTGIPRFPSNGAHTNQSPSPAPPQPGWPGAQMTPEQRFQYQQQQRLQALGKANSFNEKMSQSNHHVAGNPHGVAGLGGIGLGGPPVDYQKLAHMRANMQGGIGQSSPSPRQSGAVPSPVGMNGMPQHVPSPSPGPIPGATPSPAPSATMQPQAPTPVQQ